MERAVDNLRRSGILDHVRCRVSAIPGGLTMADDFELIMPTSITGLSNGVTGIEGPTGAPRFRPARPRQWHNCKSALPKTPTDPFGIAPRICSAVKDDPHEAVIAESRRELVVHLVLVAGNDNEPARSRVRLPSPGRHPERKNTLARVERLFRSAIEERELPARWNRRREPFSVRRF